MRNSFLGFKNILTFKKITFQPILRQNLKNILRYKK